jgi:cytochrome c-type biogenesis protein CcmH
MKYLLLFLCLICAAPSFAIGVDADQLADPVAEARARSLMEELRCLVCQNQSISDSDATLAEDLRHIVRERIVAGDSDAQVKAYLVARYGNWVLLDPPFAPATWVLWLGPLIMLFVAGIIYARRTRRLRVESAPLSQAEAQALEDLP